MNLVDEALLVNKENLPQNRFLFNNQPIFNLTISVILATIGFANHNTSEKERMKKILANLLLRFFNVNQKECNLQELNK